MKINIKKSNQNGFTLTELLILLWFVFIIGVLGLAVYAVAHFVMKFW